MTTPGSELPHESRSRGFRVVRGRDQGDGGNPLTRFQGGVECACVALASFLPAGLPGSLPMVRLGGPLLEPLREGIGVRFVSRLSQLARVALQS